MLVVAFTTNDQVYHGFVCLFILSGFHLGQIMLIIIIMFISYIAQSSMR